MKMRMHWLLLFVLASTLVFAANDPGHDTLYVLKFGDSNVTGSINITANLTARFVQFTGKAFGSYIDIIGNGSLPSATTTPRIVGDIGNNMYIDSQNNLNINTISGTSALIQVGSGAANTLIFNVNGTIQQRNVNVCLSNGTNCPGSLSSANITGSGTAGNISYWTTGTNIGSSVIYQSGSNIGVGTTAPGYTLDVNGSLATKMLVIANTSDSTTFTSKSTNTTANIDTFIFTSPKNGGGTFSFYLDSSGQFTNDYGSFRLGPHGGTVMSLSAGTLEIANTSEMKWSSDLNPAGSADTTLARVAPATLKITDASSGLGKLYVGTVGIGVAIPSENLAVNGNASTGNLFVTGGVNASQNSYIAGSKVCTTGNGACSGFVNGSDALFTRTNTTYANISNLFVGTTNLTCSQVSGCVVGAISSVPYQSNAAGWTNTTTQVFLANNNTNVSVGNAGGTTPNLFVDNTNNRVGIGTITPSQKLEVNGTVNVSGTGTSGNVFLNGAIYFGGGSGTGLGASGSGTTNYTARWLTSSSLIGGSIFDNGNVVGINTSNTNATLQVIGTVWIGNGSGAPGNATKGGDLWVADSIEYEGVIYAPGSDIAERTPASESLAAGTVAELDETHPGKIRASRTAYSRSVVGVISSKPAMVLGKANDGPALALAGRVPVSVTMQGGIIAVGDLLVSSGTRGAAMRCAIQTVNDTMTLREFTATLNDNERCRSAALGKAMEPIGRTGTILAMLR